MLHGAGYGAARVQRDRYFIAERPATAPHLAVLITVPRGAGAVEVSEWRREGAREDAEGVSPSRPLASAALVSAVSLPLCPHVIEMFLFHTLK